MTVVGLASAKGSPGVTTAALALAMSWPASRPVLVAECDAAGGDVVGWLELAAAPSLSTLAADARHGLDERLLRDHCLTLTSTVSLLGASGAPEEVRAALELLVRAGLRDVLRGSVSTDVLVDLGRLDPTSPSAPLVEALDELWVTVRPEWAQLRHVGVRLRAWQSVVPCRLLLVGDGPYRAQEVADALGVAVVGVLPIDEPAARALCGAGVTARRLDRSRLWRAASAIAATAAGDDAASYSEVAG